MNLEDLFERPGWHEWAACRGSDPNLFFPQRGPASVVDRARAVCDRCLVKADCLAYALEHHEKQGVWGGLSGKERRDLARELRRTA